MQFNEKKAWDSERITFSLMREIRSRNSESSRGKLQKEKLQKVIYFIHCWAMREARKRKSEMLVTMKKPEFGRLPAITKRKIMYPKMYHICTCIQKC